MPHSLKNLYYCIVNMSICKFWQFLGKFVLSTLVVGFYDLFFKKKIMILRYAFSEKQKYVERFNSIRITALYLGLLATFSYLWAHFSLVHCSHWLSDCIFAWNHGKQIFPYKQTKNCSSFEIWKFLKKTTKSSQIWVKLWMLRQILDKLRVQWISVLVSTER